MAASPVDTCPVFGCTAGEGVGLPSGVSARRRWAARLHPAGLPDCTEPSQALASRRPSCVFGQLSAVTAD